MEFVLKYVEKCSEAEIKELHFALIQKASISLLKALYKEIGQVLSFDIVSQLPIELSEEVFSYLDEYSLCTAARCSKQWRNIANNNKIWYKQCCRKGYVKYEKLEPRPDWNKGGRPTSPHCKMYDITDIPTLLKPAMCHWKEVYMKGRVLQRNWQKGIYSVAPLLRGHREPITGISVQDNSIISSSRDGTVCVWNKESLELVKTLQKHSDEINCMQTTNDYIITGCADGAVRVFNQSSGQLLWLLNKGGGVIEELACNEQYIVSASEDYSIHIWKYGISKQPDHAHSLQGHTSSITCLVLYGHVLASGSWDSTLRLWDCVRGVCNHVITAHLEGVNCISFNDSGQIISGGGDGVVRLWNSLSGNNMLEMEGHTQEITCVKCKDNLIVSSSADSCIRVWDYKGLCKFKLDNHLGLVRCLCLTEGNRLVSGGDRKRICVWDMKNGKLLHEVHRQQSLLHLVSVTDSMIITGAPDSGTISVIRYW